MSKISKLIKHPIKFFLDIKTPKNSSNRLAQPKNIKQPKKPISTHVVMPAKERPTLESMMRLLERFEKSQPVTKVTLNEHKIWNALRYGIWMKLWKLTQGTKLPGGFNTYKISISKDFIDHYVENVDALRVNELPETETDFLFISNINSSDRINLDGEIYQRVIDPIFEAVSSKFNARKVALVRDKSELIGELSVHPPLYIMPSHISTHRHALGITYPVYFVANVLKHFSLIDLNEKQLNQLIDEYCNLKMFYKSVLTKLNPKTVLFMNLGIHMPLCEAAYELGIKSVEIQHGAQKANTPIYTNWSNFPKAGYTGLPSHFAVWSEDDARHIRQVFRGTVKPFVAGYPWLDRSTEKNNEIDVKIERIKSEYKYIGLVSLQNQEVFPERILKIIKQTSNCCAWIIKKHPKWNVSDLKKVEGLNNTYFDKCFSKGVDFGII